MKFTPLAHASVYLFLAASFLQAEPPEFEVDHLQAKVDVYLDFGPGRQYYGPYGPYGPCPGGYYGPGYYGPGMYYGPGCPNYYYGPRYYRKDHRDKHYRRKYDKHGKRRHR